ncbi:MAG: hypothetical protein JWO83_4097 [Caulobacteraceae bacterium]|nr:hypothetical protein [Caulobacteraceae bacterium]
MTTGLTASIAVSATGVTASPFNSEVDLAIDAAGELLTIDPAGDVLIVTAGIAFTGGTASLVAPDYSNALEAEGWVALGTEDGRTIATEGS